MRHKKTVSRNIDTNNEWIKNSPIKRIQEKAPYAIELADGNYLQMLEIRGKDLYAMGESETNRTVLNYYNWLTDFNADWTIYSTTLPTDTSIQIDYLKKRLSVCRDEMKRCKNQRLLAQLKDREHILRASIQTEEQIQKYYDEEVYGDINTQHLLVSVNDDMSDEDAKALAEEIIGKLNEGKSFDEVKEEYKDSVTYENLKYVALNANLESSFLEALEKLDENSYTKEPVKTSYGYHVIYRTDQKEKPSLDDVRDSIIEELCDELDASDKNLYNKTLVKMREEAGLEFSDTVMKEKYEKSIKDYK